MLATVARQLLHMMPSCRWSFPSLFLREISLLCISVKSRSFCKSCFLNTCFDTITQFVLLYNVRLVDKCMWYIVSFFMAGVAILLDLFIRFYASNIISFWCLYYVQWLDHFATFHGISIFYSGIDILDFFFY